MKNPQPKFPECRAFVVLPGNISDSAATALMDISPTNQSPGASDWAWGDLSPGQMLAWASCVHTGTFPCGQRSLFNGSMHYNGRTLCKPLEKILVGVFFPATSTFISSSSPLFLHVFLCWFCFHFLFLFSLLPLSAGSTLISSASPLFPPIFLCFHFFCLFSLLPSPAGYSFISFASPLFPSGPQAAVLSLSSTFLFPWLPPHSWIWFLVLYQQSCWGFFSLLELCNTAKDHKVSQLKLPMSTWRCRGCPGEG